MTTYKDTQLNQIFRNVFLDNLHTPMFTDYGGATYTHEDASKLICQLHEFFHLCNIQKGDKIALIGANTAHWGISFLAIMSYGAVVVPILPEFTAPDVMHIITHSESKLVLAGDNQLAKLNLSETELVQAVVNITTLEGYWAKEEPYLNFWKGQHTSKKYTLDTLFTESFADEEVGIISYTSGTSGFSKGVLLPYRSIKSNLIFARENMNLKAGYEILSFLPLAHVFGMIFDFLFPISEACHITFLTKLPTPKVLVEAFGKIKPHLILSVPLIIEKIYFKQVKPALDKPLMKLLLKTPLKHLLYKKLNQKLSAVFGGRFLEVVIGGAALNKEVEDFFRAIQFPFSIGYGMTECGPLISYKNWNATKASSSGAIVDRLEYRIDSPNHFQTPGEILIKGDNVMLGYYKNPEATSNSIDADGWLHTGDLGITDAEHFIFIKGRSKNMLLGASGQNIYPEEIEPRLSAEPFIAECLLVQRDQKLVALVYPDHEALRLAKVPKAKIAQALDACRVNSNKHLAKYCQIAELEIREEEFEKTPKKSIKRYLYS
ncbi:MAG: AMP-binding protein [Mangrovibacterium sp.]